MEPDRAVQQTDRQHGTRDSIRIPCRVRSIPRPGRFVLLLAVLVAPALAAVGCGQFRSHRRLLDDLHAEGRYAEAARILDSEPARRLYDQKSRVLWWMDRGAVALALHDDDRAVDLLSSAEGWIETRREQSAGDLIAQWTLNDAASAYIAEPYEDEYLNVLKLLANLERGTILGGATVEARRLAAKANLLRDLYVRYEDQIRKTSEDSPRGSGLDKALRPVADAGQFIESPLGVYLSAVAFMESGDADLQSVAGRRLRSALEIQGRLVGDVDAGTFKDLGGLDPAAANVLVVALSGRGPTKVPVRYGPLLIYTAPVYFELPELRVHPSRVAGAAVEVDGGERSAELALVEDLGRVAAENHRRQLPLIRARTLIRAAAKSAATVVAAEAAGNSVSRSDRGWVKLAVALGGLAAIAATEKADLRHWVFLPGQARVALLKLSPGAHKVRVVYDAADGRTVHMSPWRQIDVPAQGLATIVTYDPN